jgi:hypothetical protein
MVKHMNKKPSFGKTLSWSYGIVIAFTAAYFIGGVLLEKASHKKAGR